MKVVLTGGGSGGHITPLLAVAHELKVLSPGVELVYIGQKGDKLADVPNEHPDINSAYAVRAGKFRRYSGQGLKQFVDFPTILKNLRDAGRAIAGFFESLRLLKKIRPDVIFIKGGFVGVPVGLAAARLKIPYITHDSDAIPGLANRIISKWASAHAVALPKEIYPYEQDKTFTVGVPVHSKFESVTPLKVQEYREALGLKKFKRVIFVTGGGNGARRLNEAVLAISKKLLNESSETAIVHVAGRDHEEQVRHSYDELLGSQAANVLVKGFVTNFFEYSGAADLVIARGSATNLAEFAIQKKACVIIPAKQLVWTVRNAEALDEKGAAKVFSEDSLVQEPELLLNACLDLLNDDVKRRELGEKLADILAHPNAARDLAEILLRYKK